ncbi:hypothetical protein Cob_v004084 [Colletotrichum orbiculare MAFF 240422]|uniref:Uncharacterized protein n=1 Tax=Colletotrichum orbiculare (strain 104-T / ATCC 96160 / CBS 514.97 / LARS 414 / MAFF 240422) TaxID=1213857 RepID=A0A484FYM1_COLOR|nr:hypothetical protein Cob_v004084 [Colletotrichum orbiculare MAFF 240422]
MVELLNTYTHLCLRQAVSERPKTTFFSSSMAGPTSPGTEGPTFAPPQLPAGWIAQWDGSSKNQTVRHADGSLEPVNPPMPPDNTNTRGIDGPNGDRGLGSMAMNALLGGKNSGHGSSSASHNSSSTPLSGLASQLMSGIGGHSGNGSSGGKSSLGKLGGALASSLLSSGNKPQHQGQQQSHQGSQSTGTQQHGGLAGSLMGGVANMFGGGKQNHSGNDFGYTNNTSGGVGSGGGYTGQAPPTSYQPSATYSHNQHSSPPAGAATYHSSAPSQGQNQSYPPPPNQYPPPPSQGQPQHSNSYGAPSQPSNSQPYTSLPPPPAGAPPSSYGQQPQYGGPANQHQHHQQTQFGGYNPATYGSVSLDKEYAITVTAMMLSECHENLVICEIVCCG